MKLVSRLRSVVLAQLPVWREGNRLAAPVIVEHVLRTLMRTTDVVVSGLISPAAVSAVGLGDMYGRVLVRAGLGIGGGAIALSSQDTGSGADANRDQAVVQAVLLGIVTGIPFMVFGVLLSTWAIQVLGAAPDVVVMGAQYLMVTMIAAPVIHLTFIGAAVLQGMGDTKTPMVINVLANLLNIVLTVGLAFGLGPFPALSVQGIAVATAIGETVAAVLFLAAIYRPRSDISFVWPHDFTITTQLVSIGLPRFMEGISILVIMLPFNAILLGFGTEVNAAYHIGRRLFQQVVAPFNRAYNTAVNVLVGQALGSGTPRKAYHMGFSMTLMASAVMLVLGVFMFLAAGLLVPVFTSDPDTIRFAIRFVQAYGVAAVFIAVKSSFGGALRGGSETKTPFYATLTGSLIFLLGTTYIGGVVLGLGVAAAYLGIVLDFAWRAVFTAWVYRGKAWIDHGQSLMADRGSLTAVDKTQD